MKVKRVSRAYAEVISSNHSLSSYLENLYYKGREATPRSWLYEDKSMDWIKSNVQKIIDTSLQGHKYSEVFHQIEDKNFEKFGPQGHTPPFTSKEAQESVAPVFESSRYDNELALQKYFKYALPFAKYLFGTMIHTKRRKSIESVLDDMSDRDTLNSNSGYPRFRRRNVVKDEEIADAISGKALTYPAILLFRDYHAKLRPVWMYPMSMNLLEYQFSQVIQDTLRSSPNERVRLHLSPWEGYEDVKANLTKMWHQGQNIDGGDTTKMDANMKRAQVRFVYETVKHLFQKTEWDDLYTVMMRVNDIDILVGPNQMLDGYHGLASGSGWTQLVETVLVMFIGWFHKVEKSMGIGDDFWFIADVTAETLVEWLAEFGLPANEKKQTVSTTVLEFLQRCNAQGFFSRENPNILGGYYSIWRLAQTDFLPEKYHNPKDWNSDMFCTRHYTAVENGVDDPGWEEYVLWTAKGQKDLIAFAKKEPAELDEIQRKARLIPGLNPTYNQEKRTKPLSSFASIKLVKERL